MANDKSFVNGSEFGHCKFEEDEFNEALYGTNYKFMKFHWFDEKGICDECPQCSSCGRGFLNIQMPKDKESYNEVINRFKVYRYNKFLDDLSNKCRENESIIAYKKEIAELNEKIKDIEWQIEEEFTVEFDKKYPVYKLGENI